jgi:hypothetical protein
MPLPPRLRRGRKPGRKVAGHPKGQPALPGSKHACRCCAFEGIEKINFQLAKSGGAGITPLAAQYGLSRHSLRRHWLNCVSARYKTLIRGGPHGRIDDLLKEVATSDLATLDVLGAMLTSHFSQWALATEIGAERPSITHGNQVLKIARLRSELNRELAPGAVLHQTLQQVTINGASVAIEGDVIASARVKVEDELAKMRGRLDAGRRQLEHAPAAVLPEIVAEEALVEAAE